MMNLGYTCSAVFAMLLLVLTGKRSGDAEIKAHTDRKYLRLTWCMALYCGVDALWGVFYFGFASSQLWFTIICYAIYMMGGVVTVFWFDYMTEYIGAESGIYYILKAVPVIIITINILILISNVFSHQVFYVNSEGTFHFFSGRIQLQIVQAFSYIIMFLYGLYRFSNTKGEEQENARRGLLYSLLPGIFGIAQMWMVDASMYSLGFAMTAYVMFAYDNSRRVLSSIYRAHRQEREEEIAIINGLAGDFSTAYSIDMETGGFIVYNRVRGDLYLKKADNSSMDYFKIAVDKGRKMVHKDDQEKFLLIMDRDIIKRRFELEDSFSMVLKVHFGYADKYFEYKFTYVNVEGKERVVIGVYDIDRAYRKKLKDAMELESAKQQKAQLEEETQLLDRAAHRDIMTGLFNRRAYEDFVEELKGRPDNENFVYVSLDVNGLKAVNDDLGHEAGDELIKGSAFCMKKILGQYGYVYRHGGDEFSAIIHAKSEKLPGIFAAFDREVESYRGSLVDEISVSYGYVSGGECNMVSIEEMSKIADQRMYEAKNQHYAKKGIDRRGQSEAYEAIRKSYIKILKVDLLTDSFATVYMDESEMDTARGYNASISRWLQDFASSGNVHPDDAADFVDRLDMNSIKQHFSEDRNNIAIHYRRKERNGAYGNALLEIIPSESFSEESQVVFLYVKNIY